MSANKEGEVTGIFDDSSQISHDWFLEELVRLVNTSDGAFPITLQVSGFLVSGYLVGGKQYFDGFAEDVAAFTSHHLSEESMVREFFSSHGQIYDDFKDSTSTRPVHFIHIRDARMFHPSGNAIPSNKGVWWRGRLSEVSAFTFGTLTTGENNQKG